MKKQMYVIINSDNKYYMGIYNGYLQFGNYPLELTYDEAQERISTLESNSYPCYLEIK